MFSPCAGCFAYIAQRFCLYHGESLCALTPAVLQHLTHQQGGEERCQGAKAIQEPPALCRLCHWHTQHLQPLTSCKVCALGLCLPVGQLSGNEGRSQLVVGLEEQCFGMQGPLLPVSCSPVHAEPCATAAWECFRNLLTKSQLKIILSR